MPMHNIGDPIGILSSTIITLARCHVCNIEVDHIDVAMAIHEWLICVKFG